MTNVDKERKGMPQKYIEKDMTGRGKIEIQRKMAVQIVRKRDFSSLPERMMFAVKIKGS